MFWSSRKRRSNKSPWDNSQPLLTFGNDIFTVADVFEGTAIFGGTGSGKTSGSGYLYSLSMLHAGFSGVVLTAKMNEVDRWKKLCSLANREDDLRIIDETGAERFNFLEYLIQKSTSRTNLTEHVVSLLDEFSELLHRGNGNPISRGDEQFWRNSSRVMIRNGVELVYLATGTLNSRFLLEIFADAPNTPDEASSANWQNNSTTFLAIQMAKAKASADQENEIGLIERYFLHDWPRLAEKTRSVIFAMVTAGLDIFSRGLLASVFGQDSTITPDDVLDGKIVVLDLPIKKYFGIGLLGQIIFKNCFQQRVEQRLPHEVRPTFLYIDEAQHFLQGHRDMHFAATARSSRCANIWLTQNISNVYVSVGGDENGKASADSLLGLCQTKIFHANSDPVTNEWASNLLGKRKIRLRNSSVAQPPARLGDWYCDQAHFNSGSSETFEYAIQPHVFSTLKKGGPACNMECEAIVYQGGRVFLEQELFKKVIFNQGF